VTKGNRIKIQMPQHKIILTIFRSRQNFNVSLLFPVVALTCTLGTTMKS